MFLAEYTDQLKSVEIIHDDIHRIDFAYLAEFFRCMGVLVCENILIEPEEKTAVEKNTKYNARIYVGREKLSEMEVSILEKCLQGVDGWTNVTDQYRERISGLRDTGTVFLYGDVMELPVVKMAEGISSVGMLFSLNQNDQIAVLKKLMVHVLNVASGTSERRIAAEQLEELISVFVQGELWFHSLNLQYYAKRKSPAVMDAKEAFLNASEDMKGVMEKREAAFSEGDYAQFIYDYAILWCEVKANLASDACNDILPFPIDELALECRELCWKYPEFLNAKVLLGLSYEPSGNSVNKALRAFLDALKVMKTECFASPVYYWVGKRFEPYKSRREDAKHAFIRANQCKRKFRNYFKIGVMARGDGNYIEAEKAFFAIINKLDIKKKMTFVDPLEIEYLFKAYTQLAYIYYKQEKYIKAIEMGEYVIHIAERFIGTEDNYNEGQDDYFKEFYGSREGEYRNILRNRLNIGTAYKILSESYVRIKEFDKSKIYWQKALGRD